MTNVELKCPACSAPIAAEDTFCEACGAQLQGPPAAPEPPGQTSSPAVIPPAVPSRPAARRRRHRTDSAHRVHPPSARQCGGRILDDGFCGTCGTKARSPLRPLVRTTCAHGSAGCATKASFTRRNEDAMALAVRTARTDRCRLLVVCDGVTSAPDSDRAALAASRAACGYRSGVSSPTPARLRQRASPPRSVTGPKRCRPRPWRPTTPPSALPTRSAILLSHPRARLSPLSLPIR